MDLEKGTPLSPSFGVLFADLCLFENMEIPFENSLTLRSVPYLLYSQHPLVCQYYTSHIEDIIKAIYNTNNSEINSKAVEILNFTPKKVINEALEPNLLAKFSRNIFSTQIPDSYLLSRIADLIILSTIKLYRHGDTINSIIFQLVQFIYDQSIQDFFFSIFSEDRQYKSIQKDLINSGITPILISYIENFISEAYPNPYQDLNCQRVIGILKIISKASKIQYFIENAFQFPILKILFSKIPNVIPSIENSIWETIYCLYSQNTSNFFNPYISHILFQLTEPFEQISLAKISSLSLIINLIKYNKNFPIILSQMNFQQVILRLLLQFPSQTFLQNKIRELIEEALENAFIRLDFSSFLIPPLMEIAISTPPSALRANAYEILSIINESSNKHGNLKEIILPSDFISFIEYAIKPRIKMLKSLFY